MKPHILKIDSSQPERILITLDFGDIQDSLEYAGKSQNITEVIMTMLTRYSLHYEDITEIIVSCGPKGSFTGLRVGASVANALGFLLSVPINGKANTPVIPKYEVSKFD